MQELEAEDANKGMENFESQQKKKIEELESVFCNYDAVISFNYFQEVSQACENCNKNILYGQLIVPCYQCTISLFLINVIIYFCLINFVIYNLKQWGFKTYIIYHWQ